VDERQILKDFEDAIIDMLLVLDSTTDTISSLLDNYKQFCLDIDVNPLETNGEEFDPVAFALREKHREVMFSRKKIETLQTKVQGMSNLVSMDIDVNPLETNGEEFDPVAFALREKHREVMFSRKKIETLQTKVQGMSNLVSMHITHSCVLCILICTAPVL